MKVKEESEKVGLKLNIQVLNYPTLKSLLLSLCSSVDGNVQLF